MSVKDLSIKVNTAVADGMGTQEANASASMLMLTLSRNILISAPEELMTCVGSRNLTWHNWTEVMTDGPRKAD